MQLLFAFGYFALHLTLGALQCFGPVVFSKKVSHNYTDGRADGPKLELTAECNWKFISHIED